MSEFEQGNPTPLEAATQVIPEDHWDVEPRYVPALSSLDDPNMPSVAVISPGFSLIAPVFGERVVDGEVQACSLEDMRILHRQIANILGDEHSHTAITTVAPYPYYADYDTRKNGERERNERFANNDAWLIGVRDGHWPLPGTYELNPATGEYSEVLKYDPHDTADKHIVFMLLAPREMQDQVTEAAEHGIGERLEALGNPAGLEGLVLNGERPNDPDPLGFSWRGKTQYRDINGIAVINDISDDLSFMPVMEDLLTLDGPEARQEYAQHYVELAAMSQEDRAVALKQAATEALGTGSHDQTEVGDWIYSQQEKADNIDMQMRSVVAITNFNTRHREGRNMTEAEQAEARQAYIAGLVRVADKLSGDYLPQAA